MKDGNYTLSVAGGSLFDAGTFGTVNFHRLYGDSDGDRDVDGLDYGLFRAAWLFGQTQYINLFDINNSDILDDDLDDFFAAFGRVLPG
ncbi:MAG: hypothetical protein R3C19_20175 [Planctomycetaceae bacterium]